MPHLPLPPFRASSLARQLRSPGCSRQWGQLRIRELRKFAQFFTSPGNGTCASGQIWGDPHENQAAAHSASTVHPIHDVQPM